MDPAHKIFDDRLTADTDSNTRTDDSVDLEMEVADSDVFDLVPRLGAPEVHFVPGAWISDNLQLLSLLGAGGMGNVWLAEHSGLETRVAVKFMSPDLAGDASCVARFGGEAKLDITLSNGATGVLTIFCVLGSPPGGKEEGITVILGQDGQFTKQDGGNTVFVLP